MAMKPIEELNLRVAQVSDLLAREMYKANAQPRHELNPITMAAGFHDILDEIVRKFPHVDAGMAFLERVERLIVPLVGAYPGLELFRVETWLKEIQQESTPRQ